MESNLKKALREWFENLRVKRAKKRADKLDKLYNKRHWVLKMPSGSLLVVNREHIKNSNRSLSQSERIGFKKLVDNAIYQSR